MQRELRPLAPNSIRFDRQFVTQHENGEETNAELSRRAKPTVGSSREVNEELGIPIVGGN